MCTFAQIPQILRQASLISLTRDYERVQRFHREAQLLASLNHSHIGSIHGLEEAHDTFGLVLELVEGETLAERILRGPVAVPEL